MHAAFGNLLKLGQVDRVSVDQVAALIIVEDGLCMLVKQKKCVRK